MDRMQRILKGKHISFIGSEYVKTVGEMVLEHYDIERYHNSIIITWAVNDIHEDDIPYSRPDWYDGELIDLKKLKEKYDKIILYDMEHTGYWYMPWIKDEWLDDVYEIWTPWLENVTCFGIKQQDKVRFMPLRYCRVFEENHIWTDENCDFDLGFLGSMSDIYGIKEGPWQDRYRILLYRNLSDDIRRWYLSGVSWRGSKELLSKTKFILDVIQRLTPFMYSQNSVRIMEMVGLGKLVLRESYPFDYFPGMTVEVPDIFNNLEKYIKEMSPIDYSGKYRDMTYKDEDFERYKQNCINRYTDIYGDPFLQQNAPFINNPNFKQ